MIGLLLVLGSVAVGTRVVASVDDTQHVWAATADLAAGTPLGEAHLDRVEVRFTGNVAASYLDAATRPDGYVLTRPVGAGELLPANAVTVPGATADELRLVTVPVQQYHYPDDLQAGELVDVYVTVQPAAGGSPSAALVAGDITVAAVHRGTRGGFGGPSSSGAAGIELVVPTGEAAALVAALQSGPVDLVRVPTAGATEDRT